jgi:hypothetical protein
VDLFKEWSFPKTELPETAIDRDDILTNVTIYWFTATGASSAHIYYEDMHAGSWHDLPSPVPTGVAVFAQDVAIRRFAAMEAPDLLIEDVRTFFRQYR